MLCSFKKLSIVTGIGLLLLSVAPAEAAEKTIDKRTYCDATGSRYFVIFCARGGSPTGHAYVVWGAQDNKAKLCSQAGFGFYPVASAGTIKPVFTLVPGEIQNEAFNPKSLLLTDRLIVEVNREAYFNSQTAIKVWATNNYNLFTQNCISFDIDVASRIGLKTPPRAKTDFPSGYLQKLICAN